MRPCSKKKENSYLLLRSSEGRKNTCRSISSLKKIGFRTEIYGPARAKINNLRHAIAIDHGLLIIISGELKICHIVLQMVLY